MKKLILLLFILTSMNACDYIAFDQTIEYRVPAEIEPFVESFRNDAYRYGKFTEEMGNNLLIVYTKDLKSKKWGRCKALCERVGGQVYIQLDEEYFHYFLKMKYNQRVKGIIYHELGHGFLHRSHNEDFSIMNSSWAEAYDDPESPFWVMLVEELFTH